MRELAVLLLLLSLGAGGALPRGRVRRRVRTRLGSSESKSSSGGGDKVDASARAFLDTYVAEDGRVRRIDQGDDTVGEGQACGGTAPPPSATRTFDAIWGWTKDNIRRPDGLLSFL